MRNIHKTTYLDPSQLVSMAVGSGHRTDSPQGNLNDFACQSRKWEISLMIRDDNHYHAIQGDIRIGNHYSDFKTYREGTLKNYSMQIQAATSHANSLAVGGRLKFDQSFLDLSILLLYYYTLGCHPLLAGS